MIDNNPNTPLREDFRIYNGLTEFPMTSSPSYLNMSVVALCTEGSAVVNVFSNKRTVSPKDMIVTLPYQMVSIEEISDDFDITFFKVPYQLFMDTMSGLCRMTPDFFFHMRKYFSYRLIDEDCDRFFHFCNLLDYRTDSPSQFFRRESLVHVLRVFYSDIYYLYKTGSKAGSQKYTYKEELAFRFLSLIMEHHGRHRDVGFYADKLNVSAKYLTMVVNDLGGRSAKEWIVEYSMLELKTLLSDNTLDLKEIAVRTGFANQSLMSRFFRQHTGMSPSDFRKSSFLP